MGAVRGSFRFRRRAAALLLAMLIPTLAACSSGAPAAGPNPAGDTTADVVPGQVIVKFRAGTSELRQAAVLEASEARVGRALGAPGTYLLHFETAIPVTEMIERLSRHPEVEYAEPNRIIRLDPPHLPPAPRRQN